MSCTRHVRDATRRRVSRVLAHRRGEPYHQTKSSCMLVVERSGWFITLQRELAAQVVHVVPQGGERRRPPNHILQIDHFLRER
jgi:hypothetical protein